MTFVDRPDLHDNQFYDAIGIHKFPRVTAGVETDHAKPISPTAGVDTDHAIPICSTAGVDTDYAKPFCPTTDVDTDNAPPTCRTDGVDTDNATRMCPTAGVDTDHSKPIVLQLMLIQISRQYIKKTDYQVMLNLLSHSCC